MPCERLDRTMRVESENTEKRENGSVLTGEIAVNADTLTVGVGVDDVRPLSWWPCGSLVIDWSYTKGDFEASARAWREMQS
jgi:hypothetical protein